MSSSINVSIFFTLVVCVLLFAWIQRSPNLFLLEGFGTTSSSSSSLFERQKTQEETITSAPFDEFYVPFYDKLYQVEDRVKEEVDILVRNCQMDGENSRVLDVACKTGVLVNALHEKGIVHVRGIDESGASIAYGQKQKNRLEDLISQKNVQTDTLAFERGEFTHILMMDRAIYQLEDRIDFLRKCYHWLEFGGYLVVHLIDPLRFDTIIPLAKKMSHLPRNIDRAMTQERIPVSTIDMIHTKYTSKYDDSEVKSKGILRQEETFEDQTSTNKIRRNEHVFTGVDEIDAIVQDIQFCRFQAIGQIAYLFDTHQYIYLFQKTY